MNIGYAIPVAICKVAMRADCHLTCDHMNLFHEILNRSFSARGIFHHAQDTGFVQYFLKNLQIIPENATNIQIIYSGQVGVNKIGEKPPVGHWICTKYDGKGNVHIYESINSRQLDQAQTAYLKALYPFPINYIFHRVQHQRDIISCGVFAIYFATLLYHGDEPGRQRSYNTQMMRNHVATILINRELLRFQGVDYE